MSDAPDLVRVRPWPDPVIDTLGHDPRSLYVETFWLPTLGPTSLLLLRHLAHRFEELGLDDHTSTLDLPVADTAQALGVGPRGGQSSPLRRSLARLAQFDLAYAHADGTVAVRRAVPPVSRRHVRRLPDHLQAVHETWVSRSEEPSATAARRARRFAFTLIETGSDVDVVERTLHGMGFRPHVCREAATWARAKHCALGKDTEARGGAASTTTDTEPDVAA